MTFYNALTYGLIACLAFLLVGVAIIEFFDRRPLR